MRRAAWIRLFMGLLVAGLLLGTVPVPGWSAPWAGVDETVIEKFAEKAGRPAHEPLINTDQGDLLLALFLLAGAAGGFAIGYWFRVLFPPGRKKGEGCSASGAAGGVRPGRGRGHG